MERSRDRYAALCAAAIRKVVPQVQTVAASRGEGQRRDAIVRVEQALIRRANALAWRRQVVRGAAMSSAAALVLVVGWAITGWRTTVPEAALAASRPLTIMNIGPTGPTKGSGTGTAGLPLVRGTVLAAGNSLIAPASGEVTIGSVDGTSLTLEENSQLTVVEQGTIRRFALRAGAVRARVAKLQPNERFIIDTPDVEVEVHGTSFRVVTVPSDPRCGDGVRTRVSVLEGLVDVRVGGLDVLVPAGAEWPAGCPRAAADAIATAAVGPRPRGRQRLAIGTTTTKGPVGAGRVMPSAVMPLSPTAAPSVLAADNDLFAAAIRAKRDQRLEDSAALFSLLIDRRPDGPLAEAAMVQRMRVLSTLDRAAAVRAATQYLARFPAGFASHEARGLSGRGHD